MRDDANAKLHCHFRWQPSAASNQTFGPVSGLISGGSLNRHLPMHGTVAFLTILLLIYRCGGSVGFGMT